MIQKDLLRRRADARLPAVATSLFGAARKVACAVAALAFLLSAAVAGEGDPAPETTGAIDVKQRSLLVYVHQTSSVRSGCFTPELRQLLEQLQGKVGKMLIVTSGYRGSGRARRGSLHRKCMAADVQVRGVSPRRVAQLARSLDGIGGVGTYCHTRSVHVDVGARRDWHWSCRGRR